MRMDFHLESRTEPISTGSQKIEPVQKELVLEPIFRVVQSSSRVNPVRLYTFITHTQLIKSTIDL